MENSASILLSVQALDKTFAVPVLKQLNFELKRGEIHALMGSNGAGKSTLCNIIAGVHQASAGNMQFLGNDYAPENVNAAETTGVRMVMQELNLFPTLSIAENLCFKHLGNRLGIIDKNRLNDKANQLLRLVGLDDLPPNTPMAELGVGQQQLIEIASVISEPTRLLIVDEPTAALTDPQIDLLFKELKRLKDTGVGIIYISHRMDEIQRIADRVSILRDGQLVATENVADITVDTMVNLMAGSVDDSTPKHTPNTTESTTKTIAFTVNQLSRPPAFNDISFDVNAGEVLGIGGLIGSGRTELLRAIFGADQAKSGHLSFAHDNFNKKHTPKTPIDGIKAGMGLVVEDRKSQGLLLDGSLVSNISLSILPKLTRFMGITNNSQEHKLAVEISKRLAIKYDDIYAPISQLSGGNQQKALIARWLLKDLPILLFDEPSRGVDARAKSLIHDLIREQADLGKAVVVVSSETQELMTVSDRILVLSNGQLAGEFDPETLTEEQLLEASFRYYSGSNQ